MKSTFTFLMTLLILVTGFSQIGYEFGLKGTVGWNMFRNEAVTKGTDISSGFVISSSYGGRLGLNFGRIHCIAVEMISTRRRRQQWDVPALFFTREIVRTVWNTVDYSVIYKISDYQLYWEIGPRFSSVGTVIQRIYDGPYADKSNQFNKYMFGVITGLGAQIDIWSHLALTLGGRLEYSLNDFVNAEGKKSFQPKPTSTNKPYLDKTNILSFMLVLELHYLMTPRTNKSKL